jgi:hypothetical protein
LIALRAYLDSSGKLEDNWVTLAAVASTDDMWNTLEKAWADILDSHTPKAAYIHMKEIYRLSKGFDAKFGWTQENAFALANRCLEYVSNLPKERLRIFYCSVDLIAHRKLKQETYQIPDPIDLCNTFCSEFVLSWYVFQYPGVVDPRTDTIKCFFDRNEYFFQPFYDKWNRERNVSDATGSWSVWNAIEEVAPVEMTKNPGIQVADIVAWARNRETFTKEGDIGYYLGHILRSVIPCSYVVWSEDKMRQQFKPLIYLS